MLLSQWTAACLPRSTTKTPSLLIGLLLEEKKPRVEESASSQAEIILQPKNEQGIGRKALRQKLIQNILLAHL
ncbi:hypothetical protein [Pseudomonas sp. NFIX28]|uniref:hypothetical protein n=1 Tax=Pseudomonas sp. NFIX28 TaxID=1566235 RepID=UPI0011143130|nr:hypothetical protein [Pseudomonas sp. NFIX28]